MKIQFNISTTKHLPTLPPSRTHQLKWYSPHAQPLNTHNHKFQKNLVHRANIDP
ncbi:hypothetical protein [Pseudomonas sp.]|uniref:hypothetical protein n=1 Tax=Pseudomonas sp. TaxID=306 RepID=UPI0028A6FEE6|nr:hypothetical protein [Pseudomonas sp.]